MEQGRIGLQAVFILITIKISGDQEIQTKYLMGKVRTQSFGISSVKTMFSVGGCTTVNEPQTVI